MNMKSVYVVCALMFSLSCSSVRAVEETTFAAIGSASKSGFNHGKQVISNIFQEGWNGLCCFGRGLGNTVYFGVNLTKEVGSLFEQYTAFCRENPKTGCLTTCAAIGSALYAYSYIKEKMVPRSRYVRTTHVTDEAQVLRL